MAKLVVVIQCDIVQKKCVGLCLHEIVLRAQRQI